MFPSCSLLYFSLLQIFCAKCTSSLSLSFCISTLSFLLPSSLLSSGSLYQTHTHTHAPLFCDFLCSLPLSPPSLSLFITTGIQLADIVLATTENDVINYLGRDYVIKLPSLCFCGAMCACSHLAVCTCTPDCVWDGALYWCPHYLFQTRVENQHVGHLLVTLLTHCCFNWWRTNIKPLLFSNWHKQSSVQRFLLSTRLVSPCWPEERMPKRL